MKQNRVIKFRAWDAESKEMIWVQGLTFEYTTGPVVIGNLGENWKEDLGKLPVMQFTGLHDKNGKEVYEGDVLQDDYGNNSEVAWSEVASGWVRMDDVKEVRITVYPFPMYEVIGNIYENPELIAEKV